MTRRDLTVMMMVTFFVVVLTRDYFNLMFYARESGQVHVLLDESEFNHRLEKLRVF